MYVLPCSDFCSVQWIKDSLIHGNKVVDVGNGGNINSNSGQADGSNIGGGGIWAFCVAVLKQVSYSCLCSFFSVFAGFYRLEDGMTRRSTTPCSLATQ